MNKCAGALQTSGGHRQKGTTENEGGSGNHGKKHGKEGWLNGFKGVPLSNKKIEEKKNLESSLTS